MAEKNITDTQDLADGVMVRVHGDINFTRAADLRVALMTALVSNPDRLVIDLAEVPYMDSSGVATLVEALQVQHGAGRKLVLCNLQSKVQGIFEIARLDMVFTIAANAEAAARI